MLYTAINGALSADDDFASPQDYISRAPRGAYTAAMVRGGYMIVDWETHVQRLVKSIAALHAALGCFSGYYQGLQGSETSEAELLERAVLPSVLACLQAAAAQAQPAGHAAMLTVLLSPGEARPLDVRALASPCAPLRGGPTWAVVLGGPREIAIGKDTAWVAQRRGLEEMRPEDAGEVLLCTRDGALLEGLVTNLFVVCRGDGGAPPVVVTAGMGDGVVWGTMRHRVLQACQALGLAVEQRPPLPTERERWLEAFITNCRQGVRSLERIVCDKRNVWGLPPWEAEFVGAPGRWTAAIATQVQAQLAATDVRQRL